MHRIILNKKFVIVFVILAILALHVFITVRSMPKGFKDFFCFLTVPVEEQERAHFTDQGTPYHIKIRPDQDYLDFYKWINFIKDTTPENSIIVVPHNDRKPFVHIGHTGYCDYFLFPRITTHEGERKRYPGWLGSGNRDIYRVSAPGYEYNGKFINKRTLDSDFSLVLLEQKTKEEAVPLVDYRSITSDFFNVSLALFKLFLLMMSGSYLALKYFKIDSVLSLITTSFMAGLVISALIYILIGLIGINFTETLQFALLGLISAPGIFRLMKHRTAFTRRENIDWGATLASFIVVLFFLILFMKSALTPITTWDTIAIWGAKAKSIFALHNLKGLAVWGSHPQYPPLWPIALSMLGAGGEGAVKLLFPLTALCLYSIIYSEIAGTRYPSSAKIILPALILITPTFLQHSFSGLSNLALTVFVVKAVTILSRLRREDNRQTWLSLSVILCGVTLTRPEGFAYSLVIILLALAFCYRKDRDLAGGTFLLMPIACFVLWFAYYLLILKGHLGSASLFITPLSKKYIVCASHLSNIVLFGKNVIIHFFLPRNYGLVVLLFALFLLFKGKDVIKNNFLESLFIAILSIFAGFFYSYYLMIAWGTWRLFGLESFTRYLMPIVPIMFIIMLKETDLFLHKK